MQTDQAIAYPNGQALLRALTAEAHEDAADVLASVLASEKVRQLTTALRAALSDAEKELAAAQKRTAKAVKTSVDASAAVRELRAALVRLEPNIEAQRAGRLEAVKAERSRLEAELHTAEHDASEAHATERTAASSLAESEDRLEGIRAKLVALASVPAPDAAGLELLRAALEDQR